jgi:gamma-glutamyltranspeptidase/glutathione hydrolase
VTPPAERGSRRPETTEEREARRLKVHPPQRLAHSGAGMIATAHWEATRAGRAILEQGGNAVDAAVAAAFALGVCEPQASGLGGQTMMLIHLAEPRRRIALDGSSRAPNRATPQSLDSDERRRGHRATTVPSTPATLAWALKHYGTRPLDAVLAPAIALAEEGVAVSELLSALMQREARWLRRHGAGEVYLKGGRRPHPVGSVLRQPALAATLSRLARDGIEDFYCGGIAREIHEDMQAHGGLLHLDDLARIPWPIERRPVGSRFGNLRVATFPPPGAGRVLIEMLHLLECFPQRRWDPDTPEGALLLAGIMQQAARDRQDRPFDPEFYPQVRGQRMLSRDYAERTARSLRKRLRTRGETTHLSVMDRFGNAVALTQSIERVFGACALAPGLGFLYNDYLSAFEHEDIGHPYYLRPNAVPWASVAPTIVYRGRNPRLVVGSPGSERIVTSLFQVLVRLLTHKPYEAVDAPRLHCSPEGKVSLEASRFRDDIPPLLRRHGFEIDEREPYSFYLGCVQLVMRDRTGFVGVADPRRDGSAAGPAA